MSTIVQFFNTFFDFFVWWFTVNPWERALRIRLGSRKCEFGPGVHFKIPYLDTLYRQSVRLRSVNVQMQTLTTQDNKTLILFAAMSYSIKDLSKLYDTLHHAEDTLRNFAAGKISQYIQQHGSEDCTPAKIEEAVSKNLSSLEKYGIGDVQIQLIDFACVRTYRLISDVKYGTGDNLNTQSSDRSNKLPGM